MLATPKKLKNDAIVEALLEVKFDSDELGEAIVGRLIDLELWSDYSTSRLNVSNIPEAIRESDPNLRYEPTIERTAKDKSCTVKIGGHVISYHVYAPYPGWDTFQSSLSSIVTSLFEKIPNISIQRLGLRYVNMLRSSTHHLRGINELSLKVQLQDEQVTEGINLAHIRIKSDLHGVMLKLASPEFVAFDRPDDTVCIADVDVFTPNDFSINEKQVVMEWLNDAHEFEKESFFSLIPEDVVAKLIEE